MFCMKKHFFQSFITITSPSKFLNDSPPPYPTEREASTHNAPPSPSGQFHDAPSALSKISFVLCPGFARSIQQLSFCQKSRRFLSANRLHFLALISMQLNKIWGHQIPLQPVNENLLPQISQKWTYTISYQQVYSHLDAQIALWRRFARGVH